MSSTTLVSSMLGMPGYVLLQEKYKLGKDKAFLKSLLSSMQIFLDDEMDDSRWKKVLQEVQRVYGPDGDKGNYRVDRQGNLIKGPPKRWIYAIQVNDLAPDPVLQESTRSMNKDGTGSFTKSKATLGRIEAESPNETVDTTPETLREAFLQSMIPEFWKKGWLHDVYVTKEGEIWIKENSSYHDHVEAEAERIANLKRPQPAKGAQNKAKDNKAYDKYNKQSKKLGQK